MPKRDWFEIHFVDAGQGDCTFIICPGGETILVDLGSVKNADVAGQDALTFLYETLLELNPKAPTLDYLFLTHPDRDHYNLVMPLLAKFKDKPLTINNIRVGGNIWSYKTNETYEKLLRPAYKDDKLVYLGSPGKPFHSPVDEPYLSLSNKSVNIYILCVNLHKTKSNPQSLVMMIEYAGRKIILTGDAEWEVENEILTYYSEPPDFLESEVLKLGHHGTKNATTGPWIQMVQPRMAFGSADMKWAHPYCQSILPLAEGGGLWALTPEHPWLCGAESGVKKQYYNHLNTCGVYTNMAYQIQREEKEMNNKKEIAVNKRIIEGFGTDPKAGTALKHGLVMGAHYLLYIYPTYGSQTKGDMELLWRVNGKDYDTQRFSTASRGRCTDVIPKMAASGTQQQLSDPCGCC